MLFRSVSQSRYRPECVQEFFADIHKETDGDNSVRTRLRRANDFSNMVYLLAVVDEVYHFRNGHWSFVLHYIMKNTRYAKATGGTPITTWLPNQLSAVLQCQQSLVDEISQHVNEITDATVLELFETLRTKLPTKISLLQRQQAELENPQFEADDVIKHHDELGLQDYPIVTGKQIGRAHV